MTIEHETVGIVVVEEQHQFEVFWILGEVVSNLALERRVALDAPSCADLLQQDVAIGKVQHAVERLCVVCLQVILREGLCFLGEELIQSGVRLEKQLSCHLGAYATSPHFTEYDDIAANGMHALTETLQECERLSHSVVDTESVHTHTGEFLSLVDHKVGHLGVLQVELRQVAKT